MNGDGKEEGIRINQSRGNRVLLGGNLSELNVPGCVQWNFIYAPCIVGVMAFKPVVRGLDSLKQRSCHPG